MTGPTSQPEMAADDVCGFLALMDADGVRVWLDGGWAVDACLGSQTRCHGDLDIVIEERDVPTALAALQRCGYAPVPRADTRAWNFVLGDDAGHQIDFHVIVLDERGRGVSSDRRRTGNPTPPRPWREPARSTSAPWPASRPSGWSGSTPATR
jgi:hypothetical protein